MLERLVDDAARRLRLDRIELRRRNLVRRFPYETPLGFSYDSGDFERCLDKALELLGPGVDAPGTGVDAPGTGVDAPGTGVALYVERAAGMWESAAISVSRA